MLGVAPAPRRFAQGMAGSVALAIGGVLLLGTTITAWLLEGMLAFAVMKAVFGNSCFGAVRLPLPPAALHQVPVPPAPGGSRLLTASSFESRMERRYVLLWSPLPLEEGDRVVAIQVWDREAGQRRDTAWQDIERWRASLQSVDDVGAFQTIRRNVITADGSVELAAVAEMSAAGFRWHNGLDPAGQASILEVGSNSVMRSMIVLFAFVLAIGLAGAAMAQEPEVPPDALIRLQRTSCFGPCPIYTVTIDARGTVTFDGERFVRVVGRKTMQIRRQPWHHCWRARNRFVSSRCATPIGSLRIQMARWAW